MVDITFDDLIPKAPKPTALPVDEPAKAGPFKVTPPGNAAAAAPKAAPSFDDLIPKSGFDDLIPEGGRSKREEVYRAGRADAAKNAGYDSLPKALATEIGNTPERLTRGFAGIKLANAEVGVRTSAGDIGKAKDVAEDPAAALAGVSAERKRLAALYEASNDIQERTAIVAQMRDLKTEEERLSTVNAVPGMADRAVEANRDQFEWNQRQRAAAQATIDGAEAGIVESNPQPGLSKDIVDGVASLADLTPGLVTSLVTRNPLPMMVYMGAYSKGSSYVDKRQEGYSPQKSNIASTLYALSEAIPEALPLNVILRGGGAALTKIVGGAATEAASEVITSGLQTLVDMKVLDEEKTWGEAMGEAWDSARVGGIMGALMGTGATIYDGVESRMRNKAAAGTPGDPNAKPPLPTPPLVTPAGSIDPANAAALAPTPTPDPAATGAPPATEAAAVDPDVAAVLSPKPKTAADVAREKLKALRAAQGPAGAPEATQEAPAAPEATQEVSAAPEAQEAPQEPTPVPESPETIEAQREALKAGTKKAVLYTPGTVLPEELGGRFKRISLPNVGVFDYDSRQISAADIRALNKFGRLNEVLELGPYSKQDVAQSAAAGAPPAAVVERTPEGTEVKAATATTETVPDQVPAMEATKLAPENIVTTEDPRKVLNDRVAAVDKAAAETAAGVRRPELSEEEKQALVRKYGFGSDKAPAPAPAAATAPETAATFSPASTSARTPRTPRATVAVETSKARSEVEVTPEGKRVVKIAPDAKTQAMIDEANAKQERQRAEEKARAEARDKAAEKEAKALGKSELIERANAGEFKDPEAEAKARRNETTKDAKRDAAAVANAVRAAGLQKEMAPSKEEDATSLVGAARIYNRLKQTLARADGDGISIPARIQDQHTNAQAWLAAVRTMTRKLARLEGNPSPETRKEILQELSEFIASEQAYLKTGDATVLREARKAAGNAAMQKGGELREEATAAEEADLPEESDEESDEDRGSADPDEPDDAGSSSITEEEALTVAPLPEAELKAEDVTAGKNKAGTFKVEERKAPRKLVKPPTKGAAAVAKSRARSVTSPGKAKASRVLGRNPKTIIGTTRGDLKDGWLIRGKSEVDRVRNFLFDWWATYGGMYQRGTEHAAVYGAIESANRAGADLPAAVEPLLAIRVEKLEDILDRTEGKVRSELLAAVAENATTFVTGDLAVFQASVAEHINAVLKKLVGSVRVMVLTDADYDLLHPAANAYYLTVAKQDMIVVPERLFKDPTRAAFVMQHEAMHAATAVYLEANPRVEAQVLDLMGFVRDVAMQEGWEGDYYFATDAHEFLSEAISNPEVQELLTSITLTPDQAAFFAPPFTTKGVIRTALDAVKALALKVLKFDELFARYGHGLDQPTAFSSALDMMDYIFTRSVSARVRSFGSISGAPKSLASITRPGKVSRFEQYLRKKGLNRAQAKEIADVIRDEFGGKATNEELDALADAVKSEVPTEANKSKKKKKITSAFDSTVNGIRRQAEKAHDEIGDQLKGDFVPGKNPGRPHLLKLATNYQIGEIADRFFGKSTNPVRVIAAWIERRRVTKARYMKELTPVVQDLIAAEKRHTREQWNEFLSLAQDSTLANVHPDRSLADNKHLGKDALDGMWGKARHPALQARYDALPGDLKALYQSTRDALTETQNQMTLAVVRNILRKSGHDDAAMADRFHTGNATPDDYRAIGEELAAHIEAADQLRKIEGPYFNLVRRGKFVVRGTFKIVKPDPVQFPTARQLKPNSFEFTDRKDAVTYAGKQERRSTIEKVWVDKTTGERFGVDTDGTEVRISPRDTNAEARYRVTVQDEYVEFVDTRAEAKKATAQLRKDGLTVKDFEPKRYERDAQNAEMLSDQMLSIMKTLDKRAATSKLSGQQRAEMAGALNEISLRFLGSTRIQSARLPRRGVAGASTDIVRNTFDYIDSASGYLAKLDTAPALEEALVDMERRVSEISARGTGSGEGARRISNEIERRVYAQVPGEDDGSLNNGINRVTALAFLYNLASPAYSLINATQVGMLALPQLSADFNPVSASLQLARAYKDIGAIGITAGGIADTARAVAGKTVTADRFIDDVKKRLSADEKRMIDELADEGLIDADGGLEIARVVDREKDSIWGKVDSGLYYLDNIARALPSSVEAINRSVTALAAYRLARKKSNHADALRYAKDMVNDTQALMSNSNAAPIFSHPVGRVALQFKKFGQMVYYLLGKNIGRVLKPLAPGERRKGATALAYITASHLVVAGAAGLPWEPLKIPLMVFRGLGLTDLSWEEFEEMILEYMQELTGDDDEGGLGEMLTFGVSRGLPGGWAFDLNDRVGMDSLMTFGEPRSAGEQDTKAYLYDLALGPVGRIIDNSLTGLSQSLEGDFSKAPGLMIPFKMLGDVAKAYKGGERGEMNTPDMVLRVIGLTSARQSNISREIGADIRESTGRRAALSEITKIYTSARTKAEIARAVSKLRDYNNSLPKGDRNRRSIESLETMRLRNAARYAE